MRLPKLPRTGARRRTESIAFGGVNYSESYREGDWRETENVSSAALPAVTPRAGRETVSREDGASAVFYHDGLGKVVGDKFYWDGDEKGGISPGEKQFALVGSTLCIYPDRAYYDLETGEYTEGVKESYTVPLLGFLRAEGNRLYIPSDADTEYVRVSDGEMVSGRGAVTLNSYLWLGENRENSPPVRTVIENAGELAELCENEARYYPDYENNPAEWYYILRVLPVESAHYWPRSDGGFIDRSFWSFEYGTKEKENIYESAVCTVVGRASGWNYVNPDTDEVYSVGVETYADGKTLDLFRVGDVFAVDGETGLVTLVEGIRKTGFDMESASAHTGRGLDHYYVDELCTGVYEPVPREEAFSLADALESLPENTRLVLTVGGISARVTFVSCGEDGIGQYMRFRSGDLSPFTAPFTVGRTAYTGLRTVGALSLLVNDDSLDFDYICSAGNRLWGVRGNTVCASKFGDPKTFDFFNDPPTAADSWSAEVSSDGEWTGLCEYSGEVLCFKEDTLHRVMGTLPENYRVYTQSVAGVGRGFEKTPAVINDVLYYASELGVYRYAGSAPVLISEAFGTRRFTSGTAGTDGVRYYACLRGENGAELFVFDSLKGVWMREDALDVVSFARADGLYALTEAGDFLRLGAGAAGKDDGADFAWSLTSCPFYENSFDRKYHSKILLRMELFAGASLTVSVACDGGEAREVLSEAPNAGHRLINAAVIPARCDFFTVKIAGRGNFVLRGMAREYTEGSENTWHS